MTHAEAISLLKSHEAELRQLGVEHLYVFGSTVRNEARDTSDIDLFFDHARGQLGVYELMDVKALASAILGRPADVMTRASLHPVLRRRIEESAVLVF
jgi:predicted nucleotidyltransferase